MSYMFFEGVAKRLFVIITPSDNFAPLEPFRIADVDDSPTTTPRILYAEAAARPDNVDLSFYRFIYCFISTLHNILGLIHLYIGNDVALHYRKV